MIPYINKRRLCVLFPMLLVVSCASLEPEAGQAKREAIREAGSLVPLCFAEELPIDQWENELHFTGALADDDLGNPGEERIHTQIQELTFDPERDDVGELYRRSAKGDTLAISRLSEVDEHAMFVSKFYFARVYRRISDLASFRADTKLYSKRAARAIDAAVIQQEAMAKSRRDALLALKLVYYFACLASNAEPEDAAKALKKFQEWHARAKAYGADQELSVMRRRMDFLAPIFEMHSHIDQKEEKMQKQ